MSKSARRNAQLLLPKSSMKSAVIDFWDTTALALGWPSSPTVPLAIPPLAPRNWFFQFRRLATLTPSSRATWESGWSLVLNRSTAPSRNSCVSFFLLFGMVCIWLCQTYQAVSINLGELQLIIIISIALTYKIGGNKIELPPIPSNAANLTPWAKSNFPAATSFVINDLAK